MIKTNKKTGQKVEIPDNTPPEMVGKAIQDALARQSAKPQAANNGEIAQTGEKPKSAFEEQSQNGAYPRFLRGALRRTMETAGEAPLRFLGNHGVPSAKKIVADYEKHKQATPLGTAGKLGGMAGDIGMAYASGGTGIVAPALEMAAQHQANNYGRTGAVNPGEAALDAGLGVTLPYVGNKIGPILKRLGVGATKIGLGVRLADQDTKNAINIPAALEKRKIPFFGGAKKVAAERQAALNAAGKERGDILDKENIVLDYRNVGPKTDQRMIDLEGNQKLDVGTLAAAEPARQQAILNAKGAALPFDPEEPFDAYMIPGRKAVGNRQLADDAAAYDRSVNKVPPPNARYNQELRNSYENELLDLTSKTPSGPRYATLKKEMAEDVPLLKAASREDKVARRLGLTADVLLAGGGLLNPAIPAAIVARRMLTSPGGGRMLYEGGRAAGSTAARRGGRVMLDLGRSASFGRDE